MIHSLAAATLLLTLLGTVVVAQPGPPAPPKKIRVGLVNDAVCTDAKSREAVWKWISTDPELEAARIETSAAREGKLDEWDVVIFPGGTGGGQAKALGVEGGKAVEDYVAAGHGVIAICAGGYLVAEGWNENTKAIELVNAKLWDDDHWARGEGFIDVKLAGDDSGTTRTMWFENGPIFVPANRTDMPAYSPLVKYVTDMAAKDAPKGLMTGRDAVIAAPFGKGRVVVFGPHPELSPDLQKWLLTSIRWAAALRPAEPDVDNVLGEEPVGR